MILTHIVCLCPHVPPEAKNAKDGTARRRTTEIINAYVGRDKDGKLYARPNHALFTELQKKSTEKYFDSFQDGP